MNVRALLEQQLGTAYRIERELGGGGMSHVFLAEEVALGRRVVVKVLPPEAAATVDAERFRREIQLAASLQHPHVVQLLSAGASGELLWYSMPYVEGESLRGRLTREHELPVDIAVRVWREVLDALSYAHGRGVVHRDIKPENVLVSGRHAVVTDFGVAKAIAAATGGASMTQTGVALGTPAYMSPEQATADPSTDHRADIYAAGLVMYEMLAGHGPFPGLAPSQMMAAHAARVPDHIGTVRPNVPAPLAALVMRCLEKRPADRPQSADEVMTLLETIITPLATTPGGSVPTGVVIPVAAASGGRSWKRVAAIAAVVVVAVTGGAVYATRGPSEPARIGADPTDTTVRFIGVVDLDHAPGDSVVARAATDAIRGEILKSTRLNSLDGAGHRNFYRWAFDLRDNELPPTDSAVSAIARWGAHAVVKGVLTRLGASYVFTVQFVPTDNGSPRLAEIAVTAPDSTTLSDVVGRMARDVRRELERAAPEIKTPVRYGLATTSSLEALRLYQEASQTALGPRGDWGAAIDQLRKAVRVDSTFAPAWRRLSNNLGNAGVRRSERVRAAEKAYAERDRVKRWERSLIEGSYYSALDRPADAIAALEPSIREFGFGDAVHNSGIYYRQLGEWDIAERFHRRNAGESRELRRSFGNGDVGQVMALLALGRGAEADSILAWGERVSPQSQFLTTARMAVGAARRDFAAVRSILSAQAPPADAPAASSVRAVHEARSRTLSVTSGQLRAARVETDREAAVIAAFDSPGDVLGRRLDGLADLAENGADPALIRREAETLIGRTPNSTVDPLDRPHAAVFALWRALGDRSAMARVLGEWNSDLTGKYSSIDAQERRLAAADVELASGRARQALAEYRALLKQLCATCVFPRIARAFEALQAPDSAIVAYEGYATSTNPLQSRTDATELARTYQRLGELYEAKGDTARAIQRYTNFVELWKDADPELQPRVTAIRERITKLKKKAG